VIGGHEILAETNAVIATSIDFEETGDGRLAGGNDDRVNNRCVRLKGERNDLAFAGIIEAIG